jgi:hypothetical protein
LAASHLLLGLGTVLAIPVAILTAATYFRYAWKATLARNEQRRLMAEVGQWDPHTDHIRTAKSLAAIQSQFQRFGFTSDPQSGSFGLTINGKQANVRLPKDPTELAGLLGRDRLAETRRTKNGFEIVIAPNIDPALLPSVVLTEIHRVSPLGAVRAFFNQLIAFALAHTPNRLWEARLARQDMRSFGVPLPAESRRPLMDLLMPPFESLDINGLDGHAVRMAHVSRRLNAGGAYAQEWAGKVDTLVSFHQVLTEDLPALREFIESRPAGGSDQFQILLVPGVNDPSLERAMADLAGKNVTVLKHVFQPSGEVKIDGAHFHSWSQGKGAIAWLTTRNSRAAPLFPDSTIPLLARLLQLLESAPPLTHANLKAAAAFARTLLTAA